MWLTPIQVTLPKTVFDEIFLLLKTNYVGNDRGGIIIVALNFVCSYNHRFEDFALNRADFQKPIWQFAEN